MPAQRPVPGVARVVCRGTAQGQAIVNVFHIRNGTGGVLTYSQAGINTLATNMATQFANQFRPNISNIWSGDEVTCQDLSSDLGLTGVAALAGSGGAAGTATPQSVAACVTWKIGRHYRGGHPRTYVGPLATAAIESSTSLTSTFVTNLATSATTFLNLVNGMVIDGQPQALVCVHRYVNNAQLMSPLVSPITAAVVDTRIDTMRRRLGPDR